MASAAYTVEHNSDGSAIVKLAKPVRFKGEPHDRLTIPRITGAHMRHAAWTLGEDLSVGQLVDFASHVIEPLGVVDALDAVVARDLALEVVMTLGKSLPPTGGAPSPT